MQLRSDFARWAAGTLPQLRRRREYQYRYRCLGPPHHHVLHNEQAALASALLSYMKDPPLQPLQGRDGSGGDCGRQTRASQCECPHDRAHHLWHQTVTSDPDWQ